MPLFLRACRPLCSGVMVKRKLRFILALLFCWMTSLSWTGWPEFTSAECLPPSGCSAMAIYRISSGDLLYDIAPRFGLTNFPIIQTLNNISNPNNITFLKSVLIPFDCKCVGDQLGRNFTYTVVSGDTYDTIAHTKYGYLTTKEWITAANAGDPNSIFPGDYLNIPVNCSCGNPTASPKYGLFATYVVEENDTPSNLGGKFNISGDLLEQYNPTVDFDKLQANVSIIFGPEKNGSGQYPPFDLGAMTTGSGGTDRAAIIGGAVGGLVALLAVAGLGGWCFCVNRTKKPRKLSTKEKNQAPLIMDQSSTDSLGLRNESGAVANASFGGLSHGLANLAVDISIEFSYEELAATTDNFSIAKEIGKGGFATVYYGELRGQRLAIKKMELKATKEFMNELKVLTRVHHANLVRLVGYCTSGFLFLVYEFVDNGTLTHHLRASGRNGSQPLSWDTRVQIALDAARGLEYIHDHTTPTYIHRDIKSSNILLDMNYRAKVGDFGLTKLTNPGGTPMTNSSTRAGTLGYVAPEYAQFGDMSPKADVYSFGVVLFQIISAKEAIMNDIQEAQRGYSKGLVSLFKDVLNDPNGKEKLETLVDPALGDHYPVGSVWKMATLAGRCTREKPDLRPAMREIVVDLMSLLYPTEDWQVG